MSTDLHQTFEHTVALFNEGKYNELGEFFDIDVIMKRVDDPGSIVGIGNLIAYLNTHQKSELPQFEDIKIESQRGDDDTQGIIVGTAKYRDKKHDRGTIPIRFSFVFTREDLDGDWLLINTFAVPTN